MEHNRNLELSLGFDLARTVAPVWWARGRWPNADVRDGTLVWVGWEDGQVVWRGVSQIDVRTLRVIGTASSLGDDAWARAHLGADRPMPTFADPILANLACRHRHFHPWSAGSLYEGVVSSIVGQSISVAAAATTERRLYALFHPGFELDGRTYWPPPSPAQLAETSAALVRTSGVTTTRAEALVAIGQLFRAEGSPETDIEAESLRQQAECLREIPGIGPWTVKSALLWGVADGDAHPTGDVALLRAARRFYPQTLTLKDLDTLAETWAPWRGWAARLLWLELLGFPGPEEA